MTHEGHFEPLTLTIRNENYKDRDNRNKKGPPTTDDIHAEHKLSEIDRKMAENERKFKELEQREKDLAMGADKFGLAGFYDTGPSGSAAKYDPVYPTIEYERQSSSKPKDSRYSEKDRERSGSRRRQDDDILEITEISKGGSKSTRSRSPERERDRKRSKRTRSRTPDRRRSKSKERYSRHAKKSRSKSRDRKPRRTPEKESKKPSSSYSSSYSSSRRSPERRRDRSREKESRRHPSPKRQYSEYDQDRSYEQHDNRPVSNNHREQREHRPPPPQDNHHPEEEVVSSQRGPPLREPPQKPHVKVDPNDFFNDELKKAIKGGRIKMTEEEMMDDGPMYTHTTNGKEIEYQVCRVFIGHLPVDFLSKDDIYHQFEKYGKIISISLHRGYAFLQFKAPEMARHAASSENGRRVKGSCLEVNMAQLSKEEARKLPREGATLPPIRRLTPQCRIFIEGDNDRMYSTQIERKLRIMGVTVDTTIWQNTVRRHKPTLDDQLIEMQNDEDSICAVQVSKEDQHRKTCTVHIFKPDPEEHRNMPVVEALILVNMRVQNCRKQDTPPPGRIASIMRVLTDGRHASLLEVEEAVEWLEKKRVELGGYPRTFSTNEDTEKLKNSISDLLGGKSFQKINAAELQETGLKSEGKRPVYVPPAAQVPVYGRPQPVHHYEQPPRVQPPPPQTPKYYVEPNTYPGPYQQSAPPAAAPSHRQYQPPPSGYIAPPPSYQQPQKHITPRHDPISQQPPRVPQNERPIHSNGEFNALPDMPRRRQPPASEPPQQGYSRSGFVYGGRTQTQGY